MSERRKVLEQFALQKEFMQETVQKNIESYRKGDGVVTVCDKAGNPIPNARVRIRQTNHAFRFGANLFMLDEMETAEKNALYKKYFAETFNMATLPFYWSCTEPEEGKTRYAIGSERIYRRPPIDLCMEYCRANHIEPREHGLAYEQWFPEWLYGKDTATVKAAMEKRYAEIAARYADEIRTIEVTNEMTWAKGRTDFYDSDEYVLYCFQLAEKYFPNNQLVINEGTGMSWDNCGRSCESYPAYIEANMQKGARIDAIGCQFHGFEPREEEYAKTRLRYNPKELYKRMDMYARKGKALQITEVTIPAYSWEAEDEEIQAALLENLYTIWFSHPAMEQIVYWNLVDGYAHLWNADEETTRKSLGDMTLGENYYHGGLFRFDFTPKPAYYKLKELIEKTWHTELELCADDKGCICFRGFYGDYELQMGDQTAAFRLSEKEDNHRTVNI